VALHMHMRVNTYTACTGPTAFARAACIGRFQPCHAHTRCACDAHHIGVPNGTSIPSRTRKRYYAPLGAGEDVAGSAAAATQRINLNWGE
jgi:hypothetical protein